MADVPVKPKARRRKVVESGDGNAGPDEPRSAAPAVPLPVTAAVASTPPAGADDTRWVKVGVGVGSAALVAALLYATRSKRHDWSK